MQYLIAYAFEYVGTPYRWGGETHEGIDCSGLVQEILMSVGIDPEGDQTAQGLYDYFVQNSGGTEIGAGSLAFYGRSIREITHVAFMIDKYRVIEAGGGGSKTLTKDDAIKQNAFVRVRALKRRKDLVAIVNPKYPIWILNS